MKVLSDILFRGSIDHPRRVAIIFGQKKFTYDEVYKKAVCLSSALRAEGVKKGDRVAVLLDNSPEFVFSYFGVLMSQAIVVPINHMFKRDEIKYILEDSGSSFLITSSVYATLARELNVIVQTLKRVFYTNQKNEPLDIAENVLSQCEPQDIAVFLYTSGTTGHPKAAMLSHLNLIANCQSSSKAICVSPKDTIICFLPLFHSFAATVCMLMPLSNGAKMVILKSPKPIKKLLRSIRKNKVTIFVGIPSIYNILKDIKLPKFLFRPILRLFNPVRVAISGAAALPVEVFTKFEQKYGMPLLEGYGLTEASPVVSLNPLKGRRKPGSIGLPLPGVRIKITADDGSELGVEQIGELCCSGDNIMRGYFDKDEDNKTTLKNGWLLTGDMAKVDIEGYAYIMGRKKEMVNVRGLNVYPREIEEVLYLNPKIKEAAIIGIPDPHRGEAPKGFVVLKNAGSLSERDIISYLKEHLALYKIPKRIEIVEELPKNSSGKILKRVLLERSQLT